MKVRNFMLEKELVIIGLYLKLLLVYPYFQGVLTFLEWIDADICSGHPILSLTMWLIILHIPYLPLQAYHFKRKASTVRPFLTIQTHINLSFIFNQILPSQWNTYSFFSSLLNYIPCYTSSYMLISPEIY